MESDHLNGVMDLQLELVEPPNQRRGGWSDVSTMKNGASTFFLKRQSNHCYRDFRRLFMRVPTLRREYRNQRRLGKMSIPVPQAILYVEEHGNALMLCQQVVGKDLNTYLGSRPDASERIDVLEKLGHLLLRLHRRYLMHGCLYSKHVLVNPASDRPISLIDLEKLRFRLARQAGAAQDLSQLFYYTNNLKPEDVDLILAPYKQIWPGFGEILDKRMAKDSRRRGHRRIGPDAGVGVHFLKSSSAQIAK